jgi:hypothetical protein
MALRVEERIVAGGEGDLLLVHHLVLRGTNRAIGRHLGEIARSRYQLAPPAASDPLRTRVRRGWLRAHAPTLFERMRGAAEAFGFDAGDDAFDASRLGAPPAAAGCSAIFVPPRATAAGHPLVSRAFDFGAPLGRPIPGTAPGASRPYVVEMYPDAGHAALALVAFDLLGGVLDGVNDEGLGVVAASDLEAAAGPLEPDPAAVGLDELQLGRVVLDTCATAAEARELLLATKHHYAALPVHWLVADRHGDAFVLEYGLGRNRVHLVEAEGHPLVLANHALHRYPGDVELPRAGGPAGTFARYRRLRAALQETRVPWSPATLTLAAERAFFGAAGGGAERTLWHGIYDLRARSLAATFFLRDEPDPGRPGQRRAVRTPELRFGLA